MDYNSGENQEIKRKFVSNHVIHNANELIAFLQSNTEHDYYDEVLHISSQPDYESAAEYEGWYFEDESMVWVNDDEEFEGVEYDTAQDVCENENIDYDHIEAYEFWVVSDWLADKLEEKGEMIAHDIMGFTIWGRSTTGQAISLDHVISDICNDLNMLID